MKLPYELMENEILLRLPVKYLLRFRCVSKEWCRLIDSNEFGKKHWRRMIECNKRSVIFSGYDVGKFYLADFEALDGGGDAVEINGPLGALVSGAVFFGAANGLVCVAKDMMNELFIFNPSTRKGRKIPSAPADFPRSRDSSEFVQCGFGYDHVNDDYKIVKIGESCFRFSGMKVIVYSLKSDSWKRIQDVPSNVQLIGDRGIFANGALHWFAVKDPANFSEDFVSFDLGLEQFKEVPLPPNATPRRSMFPVEESLGILYKYRGSRVDLWLMNTSGAGDLWSKALSLKQPGPLGSFTYFRPITFSESRKSVLLEVDSTKLVWYEINRKAAKHVWIRGIPINFESYLYTESLLQFTNDNQDKPLQKPSQDNQDKKQHKNRDDFLSKGFKLRM
ncbi:F-box protein CPR1 [Daucus carota subsp. sativus]|nr:PREDICTED: F-box protein CPR30-like [Daucus carota subsp. sativus]XP_017224382.1 PREDICTED: F-box protein CPR30-like [Daucus carota subsp. sativus]